MRLKKASRTTLLTELHSLVIVDSEVGRCTALGLDSKSRTLYHLCTRMWLSFCDEAHLESSPFVVSLHTTVRLEFFHLPLPFSWDGLQSLRVQGSSYFKGILAQLPHELPSYYKFLANYFVQYKGKRGHLQVQEHSRRHLRNFVLYLYLYL
jgi:hypothetical protein